MFVFPVAITAWLEFTGHASLPYALKPLAARLPTLFSIHMGASALALALIFLALTFRPPSKAHRWLGRATAVCVLLGGLSAIPTALMSDAILAARLGFLAQAVAWLGLLALGIAAIRRRDVSRHRQAMTLMAATASGAIVLRLLLYPVGWLWLPFSQTYACIAWAGWLLPLTGTWLYWRYRSLRPKRRMFSLPA